MAASSGIEVPKTRDEVVGDLRTWLEELGTTDRDITAVEQGFEAKRADLQKEEEERLSPLRARRQELEANITASASAHRSSLIGNKRTKEVVLPTGKISWKKVRSGVNLLAGDEQILKFLAENHLSHLVVRITREVMKSKINKSPKVADRLEAAGLISRPAGEERLFIEPLKIPLDTADTGKHR